ncbi:MAG TPA: SpoIIE family protein phosphatase, partial [Bacteroidia bacterium]
GHTVPCTIVAAVDCTGHGVPGAFMSLVGNNLLNNIVNIRHITDPKKILEELHKGVVRALKKDQQESGTVDGMDITLCAIDTGKMRLEFSSTGRSLIFIRGDVSQRIKVGTQPVGFVGKRNTEFTKQEIALAAGDTFYIFTDGFCDQFGEKEDEKFMEHHFEKLLLDNRHLSMPAQAELLERTLDEWKGTLPQLDDILVIGIRMGRG